MVDESVQLNESAKPFRWWLIPSIIAAFIGSLSIIAGSGIAFYIVYYLTNGDGDRDFLWTISTKGTAAVAAYLTLGGCLIVAARMFWKKELMKGMLLVAFGVLVMGLAVTFIS